MGSGREIVFVGAIDFGQQVASSSRAGARFSVFADLASGLDAVAGGGKALVLDACVADQAPWAIRQPQVSASRVLVVVPDGLDLQLSDEGCMAESVVCVPPVDDPKLFATLLRRYADAPRSRLPKSAVRRQWPFRIR